jgi:hypothetical protein
MADSDVFLVFVDGKPDHEEAYDRWFFGEHMADMRALPGVASAFAGRLTTLDGEPAPAQLCGYYETPDCGELLKTIAATKGTVALPVSDEQGRMVWRVLETVVLHGNRDEAAASENMLICLLPGEVDQAREERLLAFLQGADLPIAGSRLTRIGAIQPARGREWGDVLFLMLSAGADPSDVADQISRSGEAAGARFLLASASQPQ